MKILVTGAAGFVGSKVVEALINSRATVLAIDDLSTGDRKNINPRARFKNMSLRNVEKMSAFLKDNEAVIHCAGDRDALADYQLTHSLLTSMAAAEVRRLVFMSSAEVYGSGFYGMPAVSEDRANINDVSSLVGASKLGQEALCNQFAASVAGHCVSLRLGLVYGDKSNDQSVVSQILESAAAGRDVLVDGDGKEEYDIVHVEDVASLAVAALSNIDRFQAEAFNGGTGKATSVCDVALWVKREFDGVQVMFQDRIEERTAHKSMRLDMNKASRELSFIPKHAVASSLMSRVEWLRKNTGGNSDVAAN